MSGRAAAPGRRIAAFAWDYLVIAGYIVLLALFSSVAWFGVLGRLPGEADHSPWFFDLIAFVTLVLPVILYFAVQEASSSQATWGKRRAGLRVTAADGGRLNLRRSLLRSGLKFLPWQIAHTALFHIPGWPTAAAPPPAWVVAGFVLAYALAGIYLVGLFVPASRRTLYDRIAGAYVVAGGGSQG
jgi:uncharacterized RDD family membrane protein YckC